MVYIFQIEMLDFHSLLPLQMKRYLSVGRRVNTPRIKLILSRWEVIKKREMLVDYLSTLRQVCSATDDEDDLAYILQVLMLEQSSGLRKELANP